MGRLTWKNETGNWGLSGIPWKNLRHGAVIDALTWQRLYGALCKLMAYENTGLEPAEVVDAENLYETLCAKLLERLMEEQGKHRWIPVEERLPEKTKDVLITIERPNYGLSYKRVVRTLGVGFYDGSCWSTETTPDMKAVAWMPLPEPYRQEETEIRDPADWTDHFRQRFERKE